MIIGDGVVRLGVRRRGRRVISSGTRLVGNRLGERGRGFEVPVSLDGMDRGSVYMMPFPRRYDYDRLSGYLPGSKYNEVNSYYYSSLVSVDLEKSHSF